MSVTTTDTGRPAKTRRKPQEPPNPGTLAATAAAEAEAYEAIAAAAVKIGDTAKAVQVRDICWREAKRLRKAAEGAKGRAADLYDQAAAKLRAG